MRRAIPLLLILLFAGCGLRWPLPKTTPAPKPEAPASMSVHIQVLDATGDGVSGATVRLQTSRVPEVWVTMQAGQDGHAIATAPASLVDSHLEVAADGFEPVSRHVDVARDVTLTVQLQRRPPPDVIPAPPSNDAPMRANFCGMRDPVTGEVMFTIFVADPAMPLEQRLRWYRLQREAGLTHWVLAVKGGYRGIHEFDWSRQPERMLSLIREVFSQGFKPVIFLSSGDRGTEVDIDGYFAAFLDAMRPIAADCWWLPGWEVVGPGGHWRSIHLSHALEVMDAHLPAAALVWVHLVDNRITGASHPVEDDDPWQGDELSFWRGHGGQRAAGLLFQTVSGRALLQADAEPLGYLGERGYRNDVKEAWARLPIGGHGWKRVRLVLFESVAEDYYAGRATDADVTRIADECAGLGVTEWGNGLPTALQPRASHGTYVWIWGPGNRRRP